MIVRPFLFSDSSMAGVDVLRSEKCRLRLRPFVTTIIDVHVSNSAHAFKRERYIPAVVAHLIRVFHR